MTWTPLLEGTEADRAIATAREIAAAMLAPDCPVDVRATGPSLSGGTSGLALFYAYLTEVTGDDEARKTAVDLLGRAVDDVSEDTSIDPGLYGRTLGLGWTLARLGGRLFDEDDDDEDSDIDEVVDRLLSFDPWPGHYDLITGLVGLGTYWLARLPRPRAVAGIERTVERLAQVARREGGGATWFTTPAMFAGRVHQFPEGHYDLGLAHGVSGAIAFLAEALHAGVASARPLLEEGVAWMLAQRLDDHPDTRYPGMYATPDLPLGIRTAWCYGDPGVAVGLLAAGNALGSPDLVAEAAATAHACLGRIDNSGVHDAGLCHGSAGLAHIFNRLGQALGDERLLDLARQWVGYTFEHRIPDLPIAGFPAMNPLDHSLLPRPGLLEGAAGVGAALLAAATDVPPHWDAVFLVADATLETDRGRASG